MTVESAEPPADRAPLLNQLIAIGIGSALALMVFLGVSVSDFGDNNNTISGTTHTPPGACEISTDLAKMPPTEVARLQTELKAQDLYTKKVDGQVGTFTVAALAAWGTKLGVQPPVWGLALCLKTEFGDGKPGP